MKICALKFNPKKIKTQLEEHEINTDVIRFRLNDEEYYEVVVLGEKLHIRSMSDRNLVIFPKSSNAFDVDLL